MNVQLFMDTLTIMWKGMLGIFIVTAVIIGCIYLMQRFSGKAKKEQ